MAGQTKTGSGSRKHGRAARSPAHKRYNVTRRDLTNKERKINKHINGLLKKIDRFEDTERKTVGMVEEIKRAKSAIKRIK